MKVLIYSANRLFGECLERGLVADKAVSRATHVSDAVRAVELVERVGADAVLIDLTSPGRTRILTEAKPAASRTCFIALAVDDEDGEAVLQCARQGFHGFVSQNTPLADVPGIIAAACHGEVRLPPAATAGLFRVLREDTSQTPPEAEALTRREREVCSLVCEGLTNKEIAQELNRSVGTVKNHIHAILHKLDVPRRGGISGRLMGQAEAANMPSLRRSG